MRRTVVPAPLLALVLLLVVGTAGSAVAAPGGTPPAATADPALAARFFDAAFNQGTPATAPLAPGFVFHLAGSPDAGPAAFAAFVAAFRAAFPDLHVAVQTAFAQGDLVAARFALRGTQAGPYQAIPATHKAVLGVPGHAVFRVADGHIAEVWAVVARIDLLQQLGVFVGGAPPAAAGPPSPPAGAPPTGDTAAVVRRFYAAYAAGDIATLNRLIAADWIAQPAGPGTKPGPAAFDQNYAAWRAIFPDSHHVVEDVVAAGDLVMVRASVRGTQRGTFGDIPPTGKATAFEVMDLWRVQNGQLAELWSVQDIYGLIQQLQGAGVAAP